MPKNQMLINVVTGEECRIAIIADGKLEELYQERASAESHVGNIYKGRVTNVEPSIQAAFVDFGQARNGFLHISDLHPMYFAGHDKEETEMVGQKTPRRDRPPIQKCLRRGQEVVVQVLKEGIGTKGPTLTSYLSIPGRYLVMMPHMERLGVSRKVEDDDARREMRRVLDELNPPGGFGFIIRTAGIGRTKAELKRDLAYLTRLWSSIEQRKKKVNVGELFAESDLVVRTIRDVFSSDIEQIIVDDQAAARRARDFMAIASPRSGSQVMLYDDPIPLFHRFDLERQIENINARVVPLPSGGSLVIDSTEALVAIDVNSGKMRDNRDAETTAFKANLEATDEICRQLRLRDLGGVIVNDLIDMRDPNHRRQIESRFRDNLKRDRARTRVLPISQFGILEMTRQRMRPSLRKSIYTDCPHCLGAGQVKSPESVMLDVTRRLALAMQRQGVARVELTVSPGVAFQLLNRKRALLVELEKRHDKAIMVRVNDAGPPDFVSLLAYDERGGQVEGESLTNIRPCKLTPVETTRGRAQAAADEIEDTDEADLPITPDDDANDSPASEGDDHADHAHDDDDDRPDAHAQGPESNGQSDVSAQGETHGRKRRRRRRRGGRGRSRQGENNGNDHSHDNGHSSDHDNGHGDNGHGYRNDHGHDGSHPHDAGHHDVDHADPALIGPPLPPSQSRESASHSSHTADSPEARDDHDHAQGQEPPKRRRRRRGGRRRSGQAAQGATSDQAAHDATHDQAHEAGASESGLSQEQAAAHQDVADRTEDGPPAVMADEVSSSQSADQSTSDEVSKTSASSTTPVVSADAAAPVAERQAPAAPEVDHTDKADKPTEPSPKPAAKAADSQADKAGEEASPDTPAPAKPARPKRTRRPKTAGSKTSSASASASKAGTSGQRSRSTTRSASGGKAASDAGDAASTHDVPAKTTGNVSKGYHNAAIPPASASSAKSSDADGSSSPKGSHAAGDDGASKGSGESGGSGASGASGAEGDV